MGGMDPFLMAPHTGRLAADAFLGTDNNYSAQPSRDARGFRSTTGSFRLKNLEKRLRSIINDTINIATIIFVNRQAQQYTFLFCCLFKLLVSCHNIA
jgi:hypothetical protein